MNSTGHLRKVLAKRWREAVLISFLRPDVFAPLGGEHKMRVNCSVHWVHLNSITSNAELVMYEYQEDSQSSYRCIDERLCWDWTECAVQKSWTMFFQNKGDVLQTSCTWQNKLLSFWTAQSFHFRNPILLVFGTHYFQPQRHTQEEEAAVIWMDTPPRIWSPCMLFHVWGLICAGPPDLPTRKFQEVKLYMPYSGV